MENRLARIRAQWAEEPFRPRVARLSIARMISETGSRASWIALVAVVYSRTGDSGAWVSAALVAQFGVSALTAPWTGALGDRFDRRLVMIASDLFAAAAFVGIAFVHTPILLVALAGVTALAEAPFRPASTAFLMMLVPESQRAWATATRSSGAAAGVFLGGIAGGILVASLGGATTFLFNAASFVVSALLVASIRGTFHAETTDDGEHSGVWAGVRYVARTPALRLLVAASGASLIGLGMINVAEYPLFVKLGSNASAFGLAVAGWGIGQFVGGRTARRVDGPHAERRRLLAGWSVAGLAILGCGLVPVAGVVVALFALGGFGESSAGVASSLIMQRWTPDPIRARVFAATGAVGIGSIGVAMIAGGVLIAALAPSGVCVLCGIVTLLALVISWRVPPRGRPPARLSPERVPEGAPRRSIRGISRLAVAAVAPARD